MAELEKARSNDTGVTFRGYIAEDDVPDFFSNARASIFDYSATTGSSGVLHQTACYGAVPVFPNIGDFVDVCRDEGLAGANYAPDDAADMARAMSAILGDLDKAEQLAGGNKIASLELPLSDVVAFHIDRLSEAIKGPERPAPQPI